MIRHSRIIANITKKRLVVLLVAGVAVSTATALARAALMTPNSGVLSSSVVARAGFVDPTDLKFKVGPGSEQVIRVDNALTPVATLSAGAVPGSEQVIRVDNARETVIQQVVIAPGGYTGWHSHPGPVIVLVKAGALTFYAGDDPTCTGRTYTAGQSFIDRGQGHVHIGRNEGSENLELWSAYLDVPPGGPFRIDAPNPGNCAF